MDWNDNKDNIYKDYFCILGILDTLNYHKVDGIYILDHICMGSIHIEYSICILDHIYMGNIHIDDNIDNLAYDIQCSNGRDKFYNFDNTCI